MKEIDHFLLTNVANITAVQQRTSKKIQNKKRNMEMRYLIIFIVLYNKNKNTIFPCLHTVIVVKVKFKMVSS